MGRRVSERFITGGGEVFCRAGLICRLIEQLCQGQKVFSSFKFDGVAVGDLNLGGWRPGYLVEKRKLFGRHASSGWGGFPPDGSPLG